MESQPILWAAVLIFAAYFVAMMLYKLGRCPKCNSEMHRLIDSNTWMCENRSCGYCEIRRRYHG
jgi:ribosomal protein L37AE/L43A